MSYFSDVKAFHDKFHLYTPPSFQFLPPDLHQFRVGFFHEELQEYVESHETYDLPTAIDSLIDLVYITCGAAILHGFNEDIFEMPLVEVGVINRAPTLLSTRQHSLFKNWAQTCINNYVDAHRDTYEDKVRSSLVSLYNSCLDAARAMNFTPQRWNVLWDDVQRANMSKVRAERASDSKRGSTWDVIKPEGWVPPRTEALVEQMIKESK